MSTLRRSEEGFLPQTYVGEPSDKPLNMGGYTPAGSEAGSQGQRTPGGMTPRGGTPSGGRSPMGGTMTSGGSRTPTGMRGRPPTKMSFGMSNPADNSMGQSLPGASRTGAAMGKVPPPPPPGMGASRSNLRNGKG